jgi:hypothetical protein
MSKLAGEKRMSTAQAPLSLKLNENAQESGRAQSAEPQMPHNPDEEQSDGQKGHEAAAPLIQSRSCRPDLRAHGGGRRIAEAGLPGQKHASAVDLVRLAAAAPRTSGKSTHPRNGFSINLYPTT